MCTSQVTENTLYAHCAHNVLSDKQQTNIWHVLRIT